MKHIKAASLASAVIILSSGIASAHEGDKMRTEWKALSAGPVTAWTAPLCGAGKLAVQPFFFYNRTRGTFNPEDHYKPLPGKDMKYQFQQQLFAQYGLTDKLEIDGQGVYQENFAKRDGSTAESLGFGSWDYGFGAIITKKLKPFLPRRPKPRT